MTSLSFVTKRKYRYIKAFRVVKKTGRVEEILLKIGNFLFKEKEGAPQKSESPQGKR